MQPNTDVPALQKKLTVYVESAWIVTGVARFSVEENGPPGLACNVIVEEPERIETDIRQSGDRGADQLA